MQSMPTEENFLPNEDISWEEQASLAPEFKLVISGQGHNICHKETRC